MARTKEAGGRQQRGGRSPGHWELVQPDELRRFREEQRLSRAKLANLVGVSATSVQNWESGRVASLKIQRRLRALIDGEPVPGVPALGDPAVAEAHLTREATIRTTGAIVAAYVQTQRGIKPADLPELVRKVREALTG